MEKSYISKLQQQDYSVIPELYEAYGAWLYGVILRTIPSEELAQQVLRKTFVKMWRSAKHFDPSKASLFIWLVDIAKKTCVEAIRKNKPPSIVAFENRSMEVHYPYVANIIRNEEGKIFGLIYFIKGYSPEEIHEEMGIPLGVFQSRLRDTIGELHSQNSNFKTI